MENLSNTKLQIVGLQNIFKKGKDNNKEVSNFIYGILTRNREIEYGGKVTRLLWYRASLSDEAELQFIGIEVESIKCIPKGMVAWILSDDKWSVLTQENEEVKVIAAHDIGWRWRAEGLKDGVGRIVGDFYIKSLEEVNKEDRDYRLIANAYYDFHRSIENNDRVELYPYDPKWPEQYIEFADWIVKTMGKELVLRIEHIGSTAIPGMVSKPSIDAAIEIPSFEEGRKKIIPLLNNELWEYWWLEDDVLFYKRDKFMGKRTHYLHLAPVNHKLWHKVAFRDYLKTHKEDAIRYAELKQKANISADGIWMKYTMAKSEFVKEITEKALNRTSNI